MTGITFALFIYYRLSAVIIATGRFVCTGNSCAVLVAKTFLSGEWIINMVTIVTNVIAIAISFA